MGYDIVGDVDKTPSSTLNSRKSIKTSDLREFSEKTGTKPGQSDINLFSLHYDLYRAVQDVCKEKKIMYLAPHAYIDFKPAKLHDSGECWYVYFSVKNPETGRFKRYRIKVNRGKTTREKRDIAREIIASVNQRLQLGWSPILSESLTHGAIPAFDVFDKFETVKEKEMERQSIVSYRSYIRIFRRFLLKNGFTERSLITSIDKDVARAFMDSLDDDAGVSAATWNNYLSFMVTFWAWIKKRGYVHENIFEGFERKPKRLTKKKRRTLEDGELAALFGFLAKENPEYLAICLLCYCCFIRPKEIALLRCRDINLSAQTVHVSEDIAKNDNESFRTIPTRAMPVFRKLDLSHPDWFVFGGNPGRAADFSPGQTPTTQKKIGHFWDRFIKPMKDIGEGVSFYSLKDTGITRSLSEGVALNFVQQQADHSSPAITGIYVGKTPKAMDAMKNLDILPEAGSAKQESS